MPVFVEFLFELCLKTRPDEEGIKTATRATDAYRQASLKTRPDEEGIKTGAPVALHSNSQPEDSP